MKINIAPNAEQIRSYAKSALHAWDFLKDDEARQQVSGEMEALLAYLDACDNGKDVVIAGIGTVEGGVRLEVSWAQHKTFDLKNRYAGSDLVPECTGDMPDTMGIIVENVGPERCDAGAVVHEVDFATTDKRGA